MPPIPRIFLSFLTLVATISLSLSTNAQDAIRATPIQPAEGEPEVKTGTGEPLLEFANLLYSSEKWLNAARKYVEFIQASPSSPTVDSAWYRLGKCYFNLDQQEKAVQCLSTVVKSFPTSKFRGSSAFILAVVAYNDQKFEEALPNFAIAMEKLPPSESLIQAQYFRGRTLQFLERAEEAIPYYEALLKEEDAAEYAERALLELAAIDLVAGRKEASLKRYEEVAATSSNEDYVAEARMQAGLLHLELGNAEKADELLKASLESSNEEFRAKAQIALIFQAWEQGNFQQVLDIYGMAPLQAQDESRAQLLLMVAHSHRNLEQYARAIEIYAMIERLFARAPEAAEAGYRKIQCFHLVGAGDLPAAVDSFVKRQQEVRPESEFIDLARLLEAESLFDDGNYAAASKAYRVVREENIPERYRPVRYYKMGWAMTESDQPLEGIQALSQFLGVVEDDPLIPSALVKRAATFQQQQQYLEALQDYRQISEKYPQSEHTEFSLQQIASIHALRQEREEMITAYQTLLERFPKTVIAPQAWFFIGGGYFGLKQYEESLVPLKKARDLDAAAYDEKATLRIIVSLFHLEEVAEAEKEMTHYLNKGWPMEEKVMVPVVAWLGRSLYDQGALDRSERFLVLAGNTETPANTSPDIWEKLSKIDLEQKEWKNAIEDLDRFLVHQQYPERKARAQLDKGMAWLQLQDYEEAEKLGLDVMGTISQGRLNAEARIFMGDVARAEGKLEEASKYYVIVVELFNDKVMTPTALHKLIATLDELGQKDKASTYRKLLEDRFPHFKPEA